MSYVRRYLVLNDRREEDEVIDENLRALKDLYSGLNRTGDHLGAEVEIVASRDDFAKRAAGLGGYLPWCRDVAMGETFDYEPRYHAFIRVLRTGATFYVGRANCDIMNMAISVRKPVLAYLYGIGKLIPIVAVVDSGIRDKKGYRDFVKYALVVVERRVGDKEHEEADSDSS